MAEAHSECIKVSPHFHTSKIALAYHIFQGTIHEGLPQGKEETIHGLNTYVVGNTTNPKAIVVMYSDIFGLLLPNNKLIADAFAKSGEYLVYLPDFFKGDAVKLNIADILIPVDAAKQSSFRKYTGMLASAPTFIMWMTRHKEGPTNDTCMEFLQELRRATPTTQKIGMVGFCWGGRYAIRTGLEKNMIEIEGKKTPLVDAVVALHPSNLTVQPDVETLVVPTSFGWGVEDEAVSFKTKAEVEEIHANAEKAGKTLPELEHKVYKPGRHGFAVRGNPDDPQEKACLVDSEAQVLNWFKRWL
jgi:dienelactone hydrolase